MSRRRRRRRRRKKKKRKKQKENIVQNVRIEKPQTPCKSWSGTQGGSVTAGTPRI